VVRTFGHLFSWILLLDAATVVAPINYNFREMDEVSKFEGAGRQIQTFAGTIFANNLVAQNAWNLAIGTLALVFIISAAALIIYYFYYLGYYGYSGALGVDQNPSPGYPAQLYPKKRLD